MILTPEYIFRRVEAIHPDFLARQGIRALVLDVDNTLTGDGSQQLDGSVQAWLEEMRAAGVSLTVVSNNTARRVRPFAERIGLAWVPLACKPLPLGLMVARRRLGVKKSPDGHGGGPDLHRPHGRGALRHPLPVRAAPHPPRQKPRREAQTQAGALLAAPLFPQRRQGV